MSTPSASSQRSTRRRDRDLEVLAALARDGVISADEYEQYEAAYAALITELEKVRCP